VKSDLNSIYVMHRRVSAWTFLSIGAGLLAFSIWPGLSVSAGQNVAPEPASAHPEFPVGEGRDAVMRLCVRCHSPNIILASGQNRLGWENTITKMVRLGATGDDEDFTDIADYLTKNFPPSAVQKIFVNMATDKQIATVLEISVDDAKAMVAYRDKQQGFKSIEDMKQVPNVDAKKIEAKKDRLVFGAGSPKPPAS
jgi:competence protein ComEA